MRINSSDTIRGDFTVPPDKSISHRGFILTGFADTGSVISNVLSADDVKTTYEIMKRLGVQIRGDFEKFEITPGKEPVASALYCGNSGTTTRLVSGLVSGFDGAFSFTGDRSLSRRPMKRIATPLSNMGATFKWKGEAGYLPYTVNGTSTLKGIHFLNEKKSAQVKSAVLLAGLRAEGKTEIIEPVQTRDHTERLLSHMGADIEREGNRITLVPSRTEGIELKIPGDFSSASFFLALGACHTNADITIRNVSLNPSRTAFLKILEKMGADVALTDKTDDIEPYGTISIRSSTLHGIDVPGGLIPNMIDEIPLIALLGTFAEGRTQVKDAGELRFKESDRIAMLCSNFRAIGVEIEEREDGFVVEGPQQIRGGKTDSGNDHRMAMLSSLCGVLSDEGVYIKNPECVSISFPDFFSLLDEISG